jgi:hypothetical protein
LWIEQVRETIEDVVDDELHRGSALTWVTTTSTTTSTPTTIAREVIESDKIQDKIEEIVNDAIDGIEVQLVR